MPHKTIIAIICLTALEINALIKGIDGKLLLAAVAAIAGLGGYPLIDWFRTHKQP